jgi:hypothetical protein
VRSSLSDHRDNDTIAEHRHDWNQLIYVASGLMRVSTRPVPGSRHLLLTNHPYPHRKIEPAA